MDIRRYAPQHHHTIGRWVVRARNAARMFGIAWAVWYWYDTALQTFWYAPGDGGAFAWALSWHCFGAALAHSRSKNIDELNWACSASDPNDAGSSPASCNFAVAGGGVRTRVVGFEAEHAQTHPYYWVEFDQIMSMNLAMVTMMFSYDDDNPSYSYYYDDAVRYWLCVS